MCCGLVCQEEEGKEVYVCGQEGDGGWRRICSMTGSCGVSGRRIMEGWRGRGRVEERWGSSRQSSSTNDPRRVIIFSLSLSL